MEAIVLGVARTLDLLRVWPEFYISGGVTRRLGSWGVARTLALWGHGQELDFPLVGVATVAFCGSGQKTDQKAGVISGCGIASWLFNASGVFFGGRPL